MSYKEVRGYMYSTARIMHHLYLVYITLQSIKSSFKTKDQTEFTNYTIAAFYM